MSKGRKPVLVTGTKFKALPLHEEPQAAHYALSNALRPDTILSEEEIKIWDRLGPYLAMLGRLKPHNSDVFADYCHVLNEIREARAFLKSNDYTYASHSKAGQQLKSRPEVAQLNDNWRKFRSLIGEFGLAPASERALDLTQNTFNDSFDDF